MPDDPFGGLRQVHAKIDAKFGAIAARHPAAIQCRLGCHSCCQPGLTVTAIEAAQIAQLLRDSPQAMAAAKAIAAQQPHQGMRCQFLDAEGACVVYAARPALCRSHGVPAWAPPEMTGRGATRKAVPERWDVCPLNFTRTDVTTLPDDRIAVQTVGALLLVVGEQWQQGSTRRRVKLELAKILAASTSLHRF